MTNTPTIDRERRALARELVQRLRLAEDAAGVTWEGQGLDPALVQAAVQVLEERRITIRR